MAEIRCCGDEDLTAIIGIVNAAAEVYRGVIPADRWREPYMDRRELEAEIAHGVAFWGYDDDGALVGVMGIQPLADVDLIRHAYVAPGSQGRGIGGALLAHLERLTDRQVLVGTWAAAEWAIRFYRRHGFEQVTPEQKNTLLKTHWTIPERQIETSVVLAKPPLDASDTAPRTRPKGPIRSAAVRLIVARCEVRYTGRLTAVLPGSNRLLMLKSDGSVLVHADAGGYKPLNWMTPPTVIEEEGDPLERLVVRKRAGKTEDRLEIVVHEVLSDVDHEMGEAAPLAKDGVERDLQEALAADPEALGQGLRLVRREWATDIGPVDLMCRAGEDWVAVEIKRVGTIDAVEQLSRYLERIREDAAKSACRGILAARRIQPQAATLAAARGIACVEVDLELLRGEREPDLTLFV